jgi:hypothetical protein
VLVRYEDLVASPDRVQRELASRMPFLIVRAPFSAFHRTAAPSVESLQAMHDLRPVSSASVGAWRANKARVVAQMDRHGSLARELVELGYEPDDAWLAELDGVEPDDRPGFQPDHVRRRHRLRQWTQRSVLIPRFVVVRRVRRLAPPLASR